MKTIICSKQFLIIWCWLLLVQTLLISANVIQDIETTLDFKVKESEGKSYLINNKTKILTKQSEITNIKQIMANTTEVATLDPESDDELLFKTKLSIIALKTTAG